MIENCKAGDEKAFAEIVFHNQKKVFNIAYRMLGNLEEAKDLAQEVFISVFESIKDLKEEAKFDAWLTQITLNHCRNRWKYLKRRQYFNSDSLDDPVETEVVWIPALLETSSPSGRHGGHRVFSALFHQDDATIHSERASETERRSEGITCVERPPGIFL